MKKTAPSKKRTAAKSSGAKKTFRHEYSRQRDEFYQNHPRSRWLMGLLIIVFAMAIGVMYYNKNIVFIGMTLNAEGIDYPYVDTGSVVKE